MRWSTPYAQTFSARLALFYAALFGVYGIQLPFFSVWLDWRGLSPAEIGLVTATPLFLRLAVGPVAAFLADRSGDRRSAIVVAAGCGLAAVLALSQSQALLAILLFTAIFLVGSQTTGPIGEAIALSGVREHGVDYGRMRLWGSLSFIVVTFLGGAAVEHLGASSVIWMLATGMGALLVAACVLPAPRQAGPQLGSFRRLTLGHVAEVAASRPFLLFLCAVGMVQASHSVLYVFGVLHWQAQGLSSTTIGVLWSVGVVAEVMLFGVADRFVGRVGPMGYIVAGGVAAVLRWGAMALDPPVVVLFPLQVLHALSFAATHFGAMHFIHRAVPQEQAGTAQSLVAAVTGGFGMGAATLLAGVLYEPFGGLSYLAMAAIAGIGLAAAVRVKASWLG